MHVDEMRGMLIRGANDLCDMLERLDDGRDHITPQEYMDLLGAIEATEEVTRGVEGAAADAAYRCPPPGNLQPATMDDIVENAVVWCSHPDGSYSWDFVDTPSPSEYAPGKIQGGIHLVDTRLV